MKKIIAGLVFTLTAFGAGAYLGATSEPIQQIIVKEDKTKDQKIADLKTALSEMTNRNLLLETKVLSLKSELESALLLENQNQVLIASLREQIDSLEEQILETVKLKEFYSDLSNNLLVFEKENKNFIVNGIRHASYKFELSRYRSSIGGYGYEQIPASEYEVINGLMTLNKDFIISEFEDAGNDIPLRLVAVPYIELDGTTYSWANTNNYLLVEHSDFIEIEQLAKPEIIGVDFINQTISFNAVQDATQYELFVDGQSQGEINYVVPTDLKGLPIEDGSVVGVRAISQSPLFKSSETSEVVINFLQLKSPILSLNGTILSVSNIDPIAHDYGQVILEGGIGIVYFGHDVLEWENQSFDLTDYFWQNHNSFEKDKTYSFDLTLKGFGYYKSNNSNTVDITYDFYKELEKHSMPEILNFNASTFELEVKAFKDSDLEHELFPEFYIRDSYGNLINLHDYEAGVFKPFESSEEFQIMNFKVSPGTSIQKSNYQVGVKVSSYLDGFESTEIVFTEDFYELENKELPSLEISINDNIISFNENADFNYTLFVYYRDTYNIVHDYGLSLNSGFNISNLNLETGYYDIEVMISNNNRNNGFARTNASSNRLHYDVV